MKAHIITPESFIPTIDFPEDSCVEFRGALSKGYGVIYDGHTGKLLKAHRVSYCKANGVILSEIKDKVVMHSCDNPACINPNHLLLGTVALNNTDRQAKGRSADRTGANCPTAKLTEDQVRAIRIARGSCVDLGKQFNVSPKCVNNIQRGITWKNVV